MLRSSSLPNWWVQSELYDYLFHLGKYTVAGYLHLISMLVITFVFWKLYRVPDTIASWKRALRTLYYVGHVISMILGLTMVDGGIFYNLMAVFVAIMAIPFCIVGIRSQQVIRTRLVGDIAEAKRQFLTLSANKTEPSSIPYSRSSPAGISQAKIGRRFEERLPALEAAVIENYWCFPTSKRKQRDRVKFLLEKLS